MYSPSGAVASRRMYSSGYGRRTHVEHDADEAGPVLVVVLLAVAGDALAGEDALAVVEVPREGQRGDAVALRADRLAELLEEQDQGMDPVVVGDVDDRSTAADQQDRVVLVLISSSTSSRRA